MWRWLTGIALIGVLSIFYVLGVSSNPPLPTYPIDDPQTHYKVVNDGSFYYLAYRHGLRMGKLYIHQSKVDLAPFVGKQVRVSGSYPKTHGDVPLYTTTEQCIQSSCRPFFEHGEEVVAVNIDAVH